MNTHPLAHHRARRLLHLALAVLLGLALVACGGEDDADDAAGDDAAEDTAEDAAAADAGADGDADDAAGDDAGEEDDAVADGGAPAVEVAETDLGEVLVDADGMTLYGFTNDSGGTSSCTEDCASTWPPLTVDEDFAVGDELDASVFSTTEREDGSTQLVAGDWPLYRYAADSASGDVTGQGVGEVWFVVDPSGELIRDAAGE